MKVCVSIPGVPPSQAAELVGELEKEFEGVATITAVCSTRYECPNTMVVRVLTDDEKFNEHIDKFKELKNKFPSAKVRVETVQNGGGSSNTGSVTVTTLANGSKPQRLAGSHYCNSTHAKYWVSEGFIISCSYWNKDIYKFNGNIEYVQVNFNGFKKYTVGTFRANSEDDIEITPTKQELFRNLNKLLPAIKTAMDKATCYHCREEHTWTL